MPLECVLRLFCVPIAFWALLMGNKMKYAVSAVALAAALGFAGVAHAGGSLKDTSRYEPVYHAPTGKALYSVVSAAYAWAGAWSSDVSAQIGLSWRVQDILDFRFRYSPWNFDLDGGTAWRADRL